MMKSSTEKSIEAATHAISTETSQSTSSSSSTTTTSHNGANVKDSARYFFAGHLAGMAGVITGQPFDTIKVRLQTQLQLQAFPSSTATASTDLRFQGAWQCFLHTVRTGGIMSLYRGMLSPLLAVGTQKSIAFGVYGTILQSMTTNPSQPLLSEICLSGMVGGLANSIVLTPVDQLKIAMQIQGYEGYAKSSKIGPSLRVTMNKLIVEQGWYHGIFGNFKATNLRDIPMYSIYYTLYNFLQRTIVPKNGDASATVSSSSSSSSSTLLLSSTSTSTTTSSSSPSSISPWLHTIQTDARIRAILQFSCGGLTGVGTWISCYPLDHIKSAMQTQTALNIPIEHRKSIWGMMRQIYHTGGIRQFYNGLTPALLRAFPVHACVFFTYEVVLELLGGKKQR